MGHSEHHTTHYPAAEKDRLVRRVIIIEGVVNAVVLLIKLIVGLMTGSLAILGDAVHSLTDVANNAVAWIVMKIASEPPDREHPYGHRKFETLAVFGLATLLTVTAIELAMYALRREQADIVQSHWGLILMVAVLCLNIGLAWWERRWAKRLESDILEADASHTLADVLTTLAVIAGWQLSAMGIVWLDTVCALGVALMVLYLAYDLFQRAIPALVDQAAMEPEILISSIKGIRGVKQVDRLRSRWHGSSRMIDMTIKVDAELTTAESHAIADSVERILTTEFDIDDIVIHVEPVH